MLCCACLPRSPAQRHTASDAAEPPPNLGEVLSFMRLLWAVDHELRSASKRLLGVAGVTGPQRLVVRMVGRFPDASAGALAELLHVHPSTLTGVLDRLVRGGLILRREDPDDGRRALFRLTEKGTVVNAMRAGTVEEAVRTTLARMPQQKVAAARELLQELCSAMESQQQVSEVRVRRPRPKRRAAR